MSITCIDTYILINVVAKAMLFQDNPMMASYILSNNGIFVNIVFQKPEKQLFGKCYSNLVTLF